MNNPLLRTQALALSASADVLALWLSVQQFAKAARAQGLVVPDLEKEFLAQRQAMLRKQLEAVESNDAGLAAALLAVIRHQIHVQQLQSLARTDLDVPADYYLTVSVYLDSPPDTPP